MKKLLCFVLMIMLALTAAACGGNNTAEDKTAADEATRTEDTASAAKKTKVNNNTAIKNALSANKSVKSIERLTDVPGHEDTEWYWAIMSVNGLDLSVFIFLPDEFQDEPLPAMVCVPRYTAVEQNRFAEAAEKGIAVFVMAYRGYAEGSEAFGDYGGDRDLDDLSATVELASGCDFVDSERIMLFGASELSICVLRYISEDYGERIPVSAAAVVNPEHDLYRIYDAVDETWKKSFRDYYTFGTPGEYPEEFDKRSPGRLAENVSVPLYIAYFNVPDGSGEGLQSFGVLDVSYYEEYIDRLKSLGKDVSTSHFAPIELDVNTEQFKLLAEWFLDLG